MSSNPINLLVRFALELGSLFSIGYWGWTQHDGSLKYLLAIGLPLIAAVFWGTFRIPGDASSSGKAPVAVAGWVRLLLELVFFGAGTWALFASGQNSWGWIFGLVVLIHYAVSYDRIAWMLRQ